MSLRPIDWSLVKTKIPNCDSVFEWPTVFLTSYDKAAVFFSNVINIPPKVYVVDEEEMTIQRVQTLADAQEFFNPTPIDFPGILEDLVKSLNCNYGPSTNNNLLYAGRPLAIEDLAFNLCQHERKRYNGFTEQYDYCEKCGAKNI